MAFWRRGTAYLNAIFAIQDFEQGHSTVVPAAVAQSNAITGQIGSARSGGEVSAPQKVSPSARAPACPSSAYIPRARSSPMPEIQSAYLHALTDP
jgi:hypothetical protein